jgi:hypothetical protein
MTPQQLIRLGLVAMSLVFASSAAWAGDPPSLGGKSRDAYDRTSLSGKSGDAYDRAADKVFGEARREAFKSLDAQTRALGARMDRATSGNISPQGASMLTSAWCAVQTYGPSFATCYAGFSACEAGPVPCIGGAAACLESVSGVDEKFDKCIEQNNTPASPFGENHSGFSPSGSDRGAAAATVL